MQHISTFLWGFLLGGISGVIVGYVLRARTRKEIPKKVELDLLSGQRIKQLGSIAGQIAHEIATPLSLIAAHGRMLEKLARRKELPLETAEQLARQMTESSLRAGRTLQGLKLFVREGSEDALEKAEANAVVRSVVDMCKASARNKPIQFVLETTPAQVCVDCAPSQLFRALLEIVSDSCLSLEDCTEKWIKVVVRETETEVEIHITDNSKGPKVARAEQEPSLAQMFISSSGGTLATDTDARRTCTTIRLPRARLINAS